MSSMARYPDEAPDPRPRSGSDRQKARRAETSLALRIGGADYEEIARISDYSSASEARVAVERELLRQSERIPDRSDLLDHHRQLASRRYERLLRGLWSKAISPDHPEHLAAVRTAADLLSRHARLLGYEAPSQVVVHSPATEEIAAWVASVQAANPGPKVIEADIFYDEPDEGDDHVSE